MTYLEQFQRKKVFTLKHVTEITGNEYTAKGLLQRYVKKGYISKVRRNLYAALDLASRTPIANRYEIASALDDSAYISHHSALEYHGIANQVFYEVTVSANKRISDFEYDGVYYHTHVSDNTLGVVTSSGSPLVKVTDTERTIIDCLSDIDLAGGLEELIESLRLLPGINESKLLAYLEDRNVIFLWQKTGLVLQSLAGILCISGSFFSECRSHIHERKQLLGTGSDTVYYPEWKLYAPKDLTKLNKEGCEKLV